MKHIIAVSQFERSWLEELFDLADSMHNLDRTEEPLRGKILATLFYEPSTRTRLSFESAMHRLGGQVLSTENAREFSSAIKGETVEDTIRMMASYADAVVIRHDQQGAAERAAAASPVPVINGGDGPGEHPTQALLDLYTIRRELGTMDELTIALVGDLKYGRTARSLALLMSQTRGCRLLFVSPAAVPMGTDVRHQLDTSGIDYADEPDLSKALNVADVVYQTRVQRERFETPEDYATAKGIYVVNRESLTQMRHNAIIMHPLPRLDEIAPEVDDDPRAAYFRQAKNGVYVRMALLQHVLCQQ